MTKQQNLHHAKKRQRQSSNLERIDLLIRNAKALWFAMLATLVFASITLFGINDIDFFGLDRNTRLPLIGVSVPVTYFFAAGAAFTCAIYVYFQLYLIRLWHELGRAAPRHGASSLSRAVHPWLVSDTIIQLRNRLRKDNSAQKQPLNWIGNLSTLLLAWAFGPIVSAYFWWRSMPAHIGLLTLWLGVLFTLALYVLFSSAWVARQEMKGGPSPRPKKKLWLLAILLLPATVLPISWWSTINGYDNRWLHSANLFDTHITERPANWQPLEYAHKKFFNGWCRREHLESTCQGITAAQITARQQEWLDHRQTYLNNLRRPNLRRSDLRKAHMYGAFLPNVDLSGSAMGKAYLRNAQMENVNLASAQLIRADLSGAQLAGANLSGADMTKAKFSMAQLHGAYFVNTRMREADFSYAILEGALFLARGSRGGPMQLYYTSFKDAILRWAAFSNVDLNSARDNITEKQIQQTFGDASVRLPETMQPPCHWPKIHLTNHKFSDNRDQFFAHWRGWVEANGGSWPTSKQFDHYKDVTPIPPPPECPLIKDM